MIKLLLVDDHAIFRQGLRLLLEQDSGLQVQGEAENGRDAIDYCRNNPPNIVLMDLSMPQMNGVEATRRIRSLNKNIYVLGLSMHVEQRFVVEMLKAGASGFLPKQADADELIRGIYITAKGQTYLSPVIAGFLLEDFRRDAERKHESPFVKLTSREREIIQLLAEGYATKEIAGQFNLSIKTIHTHRQNIMEKLGINNLPELTKYALREGLTSL